MSNLPQHKKSAGEIARLRENLGVPVPEQDDPPPSRPQAASRHTEPATPQPPQAEPVPHLDPPAAAPPHHPGEPKPVRSLKRSERIAPAAPVAPPHPAHAASSTLPNHRHTDDELADIRRRSTITAVAESQHFAIPQAASTPVLAIGYTLALVGAAAPLLMKLFGKLSESPEVAAALGEGYHLLVACCATALPLAAFVALRKSQSRHHAAFLAIISVLALTFSLLHYFPALRYGS